MRRCARTLRRPVLDRSTSVVLVCAPERLRLSAQWATYGIMLDCVIEIANLDVDLKLFPVYQLIYLESQFEDLLLLLD